MLKISGTFLDEITHDIPSQNWGVVEWENDFKAMKTIGIDTVILIRAGYQKQVTFNSKVLQKEMNCYPAYTDFVELFLNQAAKHDMVFYFGTYDSGLYWHHEQYEKEAEINKAFSDEFMEKYGHHKAFGGWYISHEISVYDEGMMRVYDELAAYLRSLKNVPIMISPFIKGEKQFGNQAITPEEHEKEWTAVFDRVKGLVDIVAFQDGNVSIDVLSEYLEINRSLANKYDIHSWSNVEAFDRDMPIKFPPIDFRRLRLKMEKAEAAGMEKLITFEFSHFMSPNSIYPSANYLYHRYLEWLEKPDSA